MRIPMPSYWMARESRSQTSSHSRGCCSLHSGTALVLTSPRARTGAMSTWQHVLGFVGGHGWAYFEPWPCSLCKPWWYGWRCKQCCKDVPRPWKRRGHFGGCGMSCGCCRATNLEDWPGGCSECIDLWCLKAVSRSQRAAVHAFVPGVTAVNTDRALVVFTPGRGLAF